ncbi:hypothetical protein GW17_00026682 [Ensete ventricosum]|nr:hypothetical protein GW17_00026682 [Ensete ventricosum]
MKLSVTVGSFGVGRGGTSDGRWPPSARIRSSHPSPSNESRFVIIEMDGRIKDTVSGARDSGRLLDEARREKARGLVPDRGKACGHSESVADDWIGANSYSYQNLSQTRLLLTWPSH